MYRSVRVLAGAMLLASVAQAAFAQPSLEADAIAFGTRDAVANMDLSPDGTKAVYLGAGPGRTTIVYVADITAGSSKPILYSKADPERLQWCAFVSNDRLACRFTAIVRSDGTGLAPADMLIPASRMISLDIDGSDIKPLGQRASENDIGLRQYDGSIIDWLAGDDDPETVLMTRVYLPEGFRAVPSNVQRTKRGTGVVRLDVKTLKTSAVESPRDNVDEWMSDGQGHVRLLGLTEIKGDVATDRTKYVYRTPDSRDWKELVPYQKDDFYPLAIDATINALYALRKYEGRYALSRTTMTDTPVETIIATHPRVDIQDVVRTTDGQRVIGYTYSDDYNHVVYFDPEYKSLAASLNKALPGNPDIRFADASRDGNKILLWAGSDRDPGRFYLFDKTKTSLGELLPMRPNLAGRTLAEVKPVTYKSADGTPIPAYLTLPPGKAAKGLPAVVLPHGGPSARDEWGFDWLPQFLAARGYAVIQPNYRGSAGYGEAWLMENGFKAWRTSMSDVNAAARYLAGQGIADPNRVAIVGWSYGGYAALQAAELEPALYKAVVAVAPVTDLDLLKQQYDDTSAWWAAAKFVGRGPEIEEASPLRHASAINAPVLLVHGDLDVNVDIKHSQRMESALHDAGKQSELLSFSGLDHQLDDSQARALMLSKIGGLLDRTIGH